MLAEIHFWGVVSVNCGQPGLAGPILRIALWCELDSGEVMRDCETMQDWCYNIQTVLQYIETQALAAANEISPLSVR